MSYTTPKHVIAPIHGNSLRRKTIAHSYRTLHEGAKIGYCTGRTEEFTPGYAWLYFGDGTRLVLNTSHPIGEWLYQGWLDHENDRPHDFSVRCTHVDHDRKIVTLTRE